MMTKDLVHTTSKTTIRLRRLGKTLWPQGHRLPYEAFFKLTTSLYKASIHDQDSSSHNTIDFPKETRRLGDILFPKGHWIPQQQFSVSILLQVLTLKYMQKGQKTWDIPLATWSQEHLYKDQGLNEHNTHLKGLVE